MNSKYYFLHIFFSEIIEEIMEIFFVMLDKHLVFLENNYIQVPKIILAVSHHLFSSWGWEKLKEYGKAEL